MITRFLLSYSSSGPAVREAYPAKERLAMACLTIATQPGQRPGACGLHKRVSVFEASGHWKLIDRRKAAPIETAANGVARC